jgi:hypothetical protein
VILLVWNLISSSRFHVVGKEYHGIFEQLSPRVGDCNMFKISYVMCLVSISVHLPVVC